MKIMASDCDVENMNFSSRKSSSSSSESQNRRKRSRVCRESSFRKSKGSYDYALQRKIVSGVQKNLGNTCNSVLSSDSSLAPVYILPQLRGKSVGNVGVGGCDISKEIDYAITKIESLIPSLQKLVNSVHITNKTSYAHSGQEERMLSKPMTLLQKEENPLIELVNETATQTMIVKPPSLQTPENIQGLRIMPLTHTSMNYPSQKTHTGVKFALEKAMSSQSISDNTDTSSSEVSPKSGSSRFSSGIYDTTCTDESDESEVEQREVENSQSYDTFSSNYYSTEEEQYSDTSHLGERVKRDQHLERRKRIGKFRRFKDKLGKIFHHHHHHHHHHIHDQKDEAGYVRSFWKYLGSVFHHTRKSNREKKPKVENLTKKTMTKSVTIKKQQERGHFPALFQRLKTQLKHSKKSMDDIGRPGNSIRGSKRLKRQITLMPKRGGGVKFPNKGRVKVVNRSKSFAVAKKILT